MFKPEAFPDANVIAQTALFLVTQKQSDGKTHSILQNLVHESNDAAEIVATIGNARSSARVVMDKGTIHVFSGGYKYDFALPVPSFVGKLDELNGGGKGSITTPMPCKISQVNVKPGDKVKKGSTLLILEAMKMEHSIKSPKDGVVAEVLYDVGDLVGEGKVLIKFVEE